MRILNDQNHKNNFNDNNNIDERINEVGENAELEYSLSRKNKIQIPNNNIISNNGNGMYLINNSNDYIQNNKENYHKLEQINNEEINII